MAQTVQGYVPLPTGLGVVVLGLALFAYFGIGVPRADYVLQLVGFVAMVLVGLAFLCVLVGAFAVHRAFLRRPVDTRPISFEAMRGFAATLRLPAFRAFPLMELAWTWASPVGFAVRIDRQGAELQETVEALERGRTDTIVRRFVIEDPFGLVRMPLLRSEARSVDVLPWSGRLVSAPMLRAHAGGDDQPHPLGDAIGDRVEMRNYAPGDPLKLVLWKVYARTQELMVRTPERAVSPSLRIVAYLPAAQGDEPAAAAARVAVESRLLGDGWVFSADGATGPAQHAEHASELIVASRNARDTPEGDAAGLQRFLSTEAEAGRTRLVLFVPAVPGPWLATCLQALAGRAVPVTAVLCTDGVDEVATAPTKRDRYLKRPEQAGPKRESRTTVDQLQEVADTLSAAGVHVLGVERPTGKMLHVGGRAPAQRRVA